MASWLINWPGALGSYLQPIIVLHYDNLHLEFAVLSTMKTQSLLSAYIQDFAQVIICTILHTAHLYRQSVGSFWLSSVHPYGPYAPWPTRCRYSEPRSLMFSV